LRSRSGAGGLRQPWLYAAVTIAAVELWLPGFFDARLPSGNGRNPHVLRDWDRYIERTAVARPGELRILLLSNSQGRGPEYPDGQIYSALLERELNAGGGGPRVRVVNWSVAPSRTPEAIVLLARARPLDPDVVLAVFPPNWFAQEDYGTPSEPTPLGRFESDVTDTAWFYRDVLPPEFTRHYLGPAAALRAVFARTWPCFRYRDLPVFTAYLAAPALAPLLPEGKQIRWFDTERPSLARRQPERAPIFVDAPPDPAMLRMFTAAAEGLRARKVFAYQPLWYRIHPRHDRTVASLTEQLEDRGFEVWPMSRSVPWWQFLEGSVHLSAEGHRTFADRLAGRLAPLLGREPAP
jgi:hypothetical protein